MANRWLDEGFEGVDSKGAKHLIVCLPFGPRRFPDSSDGKVLLNTNARRKNCFVCARIR